MKSIVVYKIVFLACSLLLGMSLTAQKPAIDLISSHHLYQHPEAIIDTARTVDPPAREAIFVEQDTARDQKLTSRAEKQKRRQIGPSFDSLFQKEEGKSPEQEKSRANVSIIHPRFNPVKFLIFITALK